LKARASGFADAPGEDCAELAVVTADEEEALRIEPGGDASIAGTGVGGLDADALAGDPG
jgi:hypothetical protein